MAYIPVILVFLLYFTGIPIAFALFGASIFYFTFFDAGMPPDLVLQQFITATASFPLLAIPFFVAAVLSAAVLPRMKLRHQRVNE